jgi:hypothetical protein
MTKTVDVFVLEVRENSLKCSMASDGDQPFYLGMKTIETAGEFKAGEFNTLDITDFGWKSHRQLCGDEIFEKEKARRAEWKKSK